MKNVLITGGAGFVAHHIIAYMIKNTDWNIVTIDRLDLSGNLNRLDDILSEFLLLAKLLFQHACVFCKLTYTLCKFLSCHCILVEGPAKFRFF